MEERLTLAERGKMDVLKINDDDDDDDDSVPTKVQFSVTLFRTVQRVFQIILKIKMFSVYF